MGLFSKEKTNSSKNSLSESRKLQEFIELTKNSVITISDSIDSLNYGMDDTLKNSEQIAVAVSEMADGSKDQLSLVNNTTSLIETLYTTVDKINQSIEDVQALAVGSNEAVAKGRDNLYSYNETISVITDSMQNTAEFISILRENINEIANTISFIVRISENLKMLSLNASIEAARVGEAGKGFAVVAQEITTLSNDTRNGIGKINNILEKILENSDNVEGSINQSITDFESGKEIFNESIRSFEDIASKNQTVLTQIEEAGVEVSNIVRITKDTTETSQRLNASAEDITNKTNEISGIVNNELNDIQNINTSVGSLQNMLDRLEGLINKYNNDIKPVSKMPVKQIKIGVITPFGHEFWLQIKDGIMYAKKELAKKNCIVDFMPIEELTLKNYTDAMNQCINEGYAGIALVGYYEELAELVNRASSKGIPCITFNSEFEKPSKRLTFVGQNAYDSGVISANTVAAKINNSGKVVIVTSDKSITNHEIRRSGFNDTIAKYKDIQVVSVIEGHENNDEVYKKLDECVAKNGAIDAIYITAGGQVGAAKWVEDHKLIGKTKIVLYDFMRNILEYIAKGTVTAAIGQDPFRQGHDPVIYLYNNIVAGLLPPSDNMWTRIDVVDKNNVENYL